MILQGSGKYVLLMVALLLAFSACDTQRVFEENVAIENHVWKVEDTVSFEMDITDTITPHNFYINVRNTGAYKWSNLYVFFKTEFPNGKTSRDTIECPLADKTGKWLGDGTGNVLNNQLMFKYNMRFPLPGKYRFTLEQAMREKELEEIIDVGFRLEKTI